MKVLLYIARQNNIKAEISNGGDRNDSLIFVNKFKGAHKLEIGFDKSLENLALVGEKGSSMLDLKNHRITLLADHDRLLFNALNRSEEGVFKNLSLKKTEEKIEMMRADD